MSSKKKLLLPLLVIFLLVLIIIYSLIEYKLSFSINGRDIESIEVFSTYEDLGAKAYYKGLFTEKKPLKVKRESKLDVNKVGNYFVTYSVKFKNKTYSKTRLVRVKDTTAPEINILNEKANYCSKSKSDDLSYIALDNYDGDITKNVKKKIAGDELVLSVFDSSNNETVKKIQYKVIDEEAPTISLNGKKNIYINLNEQYYEYGAKAYDSCDGDISDKITITNEVNTSAVGKYKVIYNIVDSAGVSSKAERTVHVVQKPEEISYPVPTGATIYLTFDDGPGRYTETLLNILDKYNIKATFFVTNQFPKYQYLIKTEKERGHTIALHTYSHKWSIYSSLDDYLNDFNMMNQIIYNQTGEYAKYFRFPGGSSNLVSKKYCEGIVTEAANYLTNNGYQYFDWNIDSGDTARNNTKNSIVSTMKKSLKSNSYYIVLMHDIHSNTIKALPEVIEYALSKGYTFKPITSDTPAVHLKIAN